jgi:hypothetical protein
MVGVLTTEQEVICVKKQVGSIGNGYPGAIIAKPAKAAGCYYKPPDGRRCGKGSKLPVIPQPRVVEHQRGQPPFFE